MLRHRAAARPDGRRLSLPASAEAVQCIAPAVLQRVLDPGFGMAVWTRCLGGDVSRAVPPILAGAKFETVYEGTPDDAVAELAGRHPDCGALLPDIAMLARLFATVATSPVVRLRFELVSDDACRCFHVDNVGLRMLCTYAGLGTEWQDRDGRTHRIDPGSVAILKGLRFPDQSPRIPHRSPPVEHLPPRQRPRLLLVIDQPGVF